MIMVAMEKLYYMRMVAMGKLYYMRMVAIEKLILYENGCHGKAMMKSEFDPIAIMLGENTF